MMTEKKKSENLALRIRRNIRSFSKTEIAIKIQQGKKEPDAYI